MIQIASDENPALHLFLEPDADDLANAKIAEVQKDLENWKAVAAATDFDELSKASVQK